ncbi:MAG: IS1182 family transposase [Acidobacteria bacterium]|nr:MAG: IS1182 family transposase [Acidobacteriota bacterium]
MGYIKGKERGQSVLFPGTVDEYIGENNEVRAIAAFLGRLDFVKLRFVRGQAAGTGRPGYDPRLLMGLFLWGHLNGIRSSRKLERESHRNLEVIWLCENLRPDFKTIADFRKDNGAGIKGVVVEFRLWCLRAGLYGKEIVAVDGSKFKAVNSKERNFTKKKLSQIIARERAKISEYLEAVAVADETESEEPELSAAQLKEKIAGLERYLAEHEELERQLEATGESQVSLTDPEAKLMKTDKGSEVSYNVQTAVDSKHKLIAAYEVTNERNDLGQLAVMAFQAKEALQVAELTVLADGGYYEGNALKECEQAGITTFVSVPKSKEAERLGIFAQSQFRYDQEQDLYVCPQGEELHWTKTINDRERNKKFKVYATKACAQCPLRAQCTTSKYGRKIKRWVDQGVIDRLRERIRGQPELLKQRKTLAEHPFGTIKRGMNQGFFLLKGISKVTTETGLTVLSYNLKRVLNIMGVEQMISSLAKANPCSA